MPKPTTERQAFERERDELLTQVDNYQRELDATPIEAQERRERLTWQIRRSERRLAEIKTRLTNGRAV
jgi:hypothetical protein